MCAASADLSPPKALSRGLYVVPTPIGNLSDITLRALDVLTHAAEVWCEDTRVTQRLLSAYAIKQKLFVYNDAARPATRQRILSNIAAGAAVALVSDAGTPMIADPGYKLIAGAREKGLPVTVLPGACAFVTAIVGSGLPTACIQFHGFFPKKLQEQQALVTALESEVTHCFYERASRLLRTLQAVQDSRPQARVSVGRELSKRYEEQVCGTSAEVISYYTERPLKGECVLCIYEPAPELSCGDPRLAATAQALHHSGVSAKQSVDVLKALFPDLTKRDIYAYVQKLFDATPTSPVL